MAYLLLIISFYITNLIDACQSIIIPNGFVKSPSAALRFIFVIVAYIVSTPHSSGFARLASGAFYVAIPILTFYEIIILNDFAKSPSAES
jgi:hypothetical protein